MPFEAHFNIWRYTTPDSADRVLDRGFYLNLNFIKQVRVERDATQVALYMEGPDKPTKVLSDDVASQFIVDLNTLVGMGLWYYARPAGLSVQDQGFYLNLTAIKQVRIDRDNSTVFIYMEGPEKPTKTLYDDVAYQFLAAFNAFIASGGPPEDGGGGTGGGATASILQALVDFGFENGNEGDVARITVEAPWVTPTSTIFCQSMAADTDDHDADDVVVENIQAWAENISTGRFDIVALAPQNSWGRYIIKAIGF